ncbi:putative sulfate exporter family transporter [Actinomyces sp. B33]|uniref:YeiH family protein n=1 Tax=Actinomyces sp. B33 TaxID=2942131 RepID=UPI0023402723|nr:putative sulfate exporter family transporter [Actinomyces sp. B33]MDC4232565.1 putative sulfate exporter family transporter [Actinomyces sp. B33]
MPDAPASPASRPALTPEPTSAPTPTPAPSASRLLPGLAVCAAAVAASLTVNALAPTVSALLVAIVLGVVARNALRLPTRLDPGLAFASKRLLRAGVVLLGLQLVVADIVALGAGMVLVVVAVVLVGFCAALLIGRWLRMSLTQSLLIAGGFSICGAAAVAAVDGVIETEDREEVVTAVALVVIFGTLMIPVVPAVGALAGLDPMMTGLWAGSSVHEVAQVVAIGGSISQEALSGAVVVKLARVLMLAPVMAAIGLWRRSAVSRGRAVDGMGTEGGRLPPIMPLFVLGFIAMVALRWTGLVPVGVLGALKPIQTGLLAAAMFALGTGVRIRDFVAVGPRPFVVAGATTLVVAVTGYAGVLLTR